MNNRRRQKDRSRAILDKKTGWTDFMDMMIKASKDLYKKGINLSGGDDNEQETEKEI